MKMCERLVSFPVALLSLHPLSGSLQKIEAIQEYENLRASMQTVALLHQQLPTSPRSSDRFRD